MTVLPCSRVDMMHKNIQVWARITCGETTISKPFTQTCQGWSMVHFVMYYQLKVVIQGQLWFILLTGGFYPHTLQQFQQFREFRIAVPATSLSPPPPPDLISTSNMIVCVRYIRRQRCLTAAITWQLSEARQNEGAKLFFFLESALRNSRFNHSSQLCIIFLQHNFALKGAGKRYYAPPLRILAGHGLPLLFRHNCVIRRYSTIEMPET